MQVWHVSYVSLVSTLSQLMGSNAYSTCHCSVIFYTVPFCFQNQIVAVGQTEADLKEQWSVRTMRTMSAADDDDDGCDVGGGDDDLLSYY